MEFLNLHGLSTFLNELKTNFVNSFNGRKGNVSPTKGDYSIDKISPTSGATEGQIPVLVNNGTEQSPDLEFEMQNVPSGGHAILNPAGTEMTQQPDLQFADAHLTNDTQNNATVVENIKEVDPADYASTTDEGIIVTDDGDDALIGPVSDDIVEVIADGNKTYAQLFSDLMSDPNFSIDKFTLYSELKIGSILHTIKYNSNSSIQFYGESAHSNRLNMYNVIIPKSGSGVSITYYEYTMSDTTYTRTDISSSQPSEGTVITLYYGNKKATVDLQTTANRCLYDSNTTVKQKIDEKLNSVSVASGIVTCPYSSTYYCIGSVTVPSTTKAVVANVVSSTDARIDSLHTRVVKASDTMWQIVVIGVQFSQGASCTAAWIAL